MTGKCFCWPCFALNLQSMRSYVISSNLLFLVIEVTVLVASDVAWGSCDAPWARAMCARSSGQSCSLLLEKQSRTPSLVILKGTVISWREGDLYKFANLWFSSQYKTIRIVLAWPQLSPSAGIKWDWPSCEVLTRVVIWFIKTTANWFSQAILMKLCARPFKSLVLKARSSKSCRNWKAMLSTTISLTCD